MDLEFEGQREKLEALFRTLKALKKEETFEDLFKKPFPQIKHAVDIGIHNMYETFPGSDSPGLGKFIICTALANFSDVLHSFLSNSQISAIVKGNAEKVREEINSKIIEELNPLILAFFKWDMDRRSWKNQADKVAYLKKTIQELEGELKGERDNVVQKYLTLLLYCFVDQMDKGLFSVPDSVFEQFKINKEQAFETRNKLKEMADSNQVSEVAKDIEESYLEILRPISKRFYEGIFKSTSRFDYLVVAFLSAQNDYKNVVADLVDKLSQEKINDIEMALIKEDIPTFIKLVHGIIKTIPNRHKKTNESFYHVILHVIIKSVGCDITSEVPLIDGAIDSVVEFDNIIYVIEYKLADSDTALKQIKEKKYYEPYLNKKKKIRLLGLSFDIKESNINSKYSTENIEPS
jgi:hypothetical protein